MERLKVLSHQSESINRIEDLQEIKNMVPLKVANLAAFCFVGIGSCPESRIRPKITEPKRRAILKMLQKLANELTLVMKTRRLPTRLINARNIANSFCCPFFSLC